MCAADAKLTPVDQALVAIQRDLGQTLTDPPHLHVVPLPSRRIRNVVFLADDAGGAFYEGGGISPNDDLAHLLARMGNEVSDALARGTFGERLSWPTCPQHDTALHARVQDDFAVWLCRRPPFHVAGLVGSLLYPVA